MNRKISVIIPNHTGQATIGRCLEAVFSSEYEPFEVIVVDDCSTDDSVLIIGKFPCNLIRLNEHSGASRARNTGARSSSGEILFFIDSDCVLLKDTLSLVAGAFTDSDDKETVIGGTYTRVAYDDTFFSTFQSVFINYSETKRNEPDYIASHAMAMPAAIFRESGGFPETFLPIIEDVEFSHRLRKMGYRLVMRPEILVRHIFNFTFLSSLRNAFKKSRYWTMYSLANKDLFRDSGTASAELKTDVVSFFVAALLLVPSAIFSIWSLLLFIPLILLINLQVNRHFLSALQETKGPAFAVPAALYYMLIYPLAVGAGSLTGMMTYYLSPGKRR